MHRALQIEEILLHIFSYCGTPKYRRWPRHPTRRRLQYANVHLAALASTCKTFKEPALDMIWAELDDLTPLVRCLPETSWVQLEDVYSLQKCLCQTEWNVILDHASRVRSLPRLHGSFGLDKSCIDALSDPPTTAEPIFPKLSTLGLCEPSKTTLPLLPYLTNSKLTDVWLDRMGNFGASIEAFGMRCPRVTDLYVSGWPPESEWSYSDAIPSLICRWHGLRCVDCRSTYLSIDALSHLSCLPSLSSMAFKVGDTLVDRIPSASLFSTTLAFSALDNVYLGSNSLGPVCRLLRRLHLPVVHCLSVGLLVGPTAPDLVSFFVSLQDACTKRGRLNHLSLRTYHAHSQFNDIPSDDGSRYCITFDRLCPITPFVNLKSITLDIPCRVDLNERELLSLASSWPHLEIFEVGKNYDWTPSSAITPGGFLQLLEKCRSLRVLHCVLDTHGFTEIPQGHPWRGMTMPQHTFIHLLNSPIEEESIVTLGIFFHVAPYPNFSLTTHWNNRYFRGSERPQELCDLYYDRWVQARSLALDLWEKRRELRCAVEARRQSE